MIAFNCARPTSAAPSVVEATAQSRMVLSGDVVTMVPGQDVIRSGRVCIAGNSIVAVVPAGTALPAPFEQLTPVQTDGTIYPGLIDLHNHLTYNHVPLWSVPQRYTNRETWRTNEPLYRARVRTPYHLLAENADVDYRRSIVRFAECRGLFGGVTSGQGMSMSSSTGFRTYFKGLMRNVEQPLDAAFQACGGQTLNLKPGEVESVLVPALQTGRPFIYHLSEGTDDAARRMFLNLRRANGSWAIQKNLVCIHCVALRPEDFDQLKAAAGMVWSPTSNLLLYGTTADVAQARLRGIPIALGADWAPSGCKNLLGELKVARAVNSHLGGGVFTARELVEAVTAVPARMIGWDAQVGTLASGRRADILVLEGKSADPYTHLVDSNESSVRAVLIDGRIRLAEAPALAVGDPLTSEPITIGGKHYVLDLTEAQQDGLGGMRLSTAIAKLSYGLEHLPELSASFATRLEAMTLGDAAVDYRLLTDMEEEAAGEPGLPTFQVMEEAQTAAAVTQVQPMRLEPLTSVDDPGFGLRMRANPNLPEYVKAIF